MSGESQLTFDDINSDTPDELYSAVSSVADTIVDDDRQRSGDNCATISQRETNDDTPTFCVQLPPRTNEFSITDFTNTDETLNLTFSSSVLETEEPTHITWTFTGQHPKHNNFQIIIVKPVENNLTEEQETDKNTVQTDYTEFDFTKFVRKTE